MPYRFHYHRFIVAPASLISLLLLGGCSLLSEAQAKLVDVQSSLTHSSAPVHAASSAADIALSSHLKEVGATMYGTYWCPYCHQQKELFGAEASQSMPYVECDARGQNGQPEACREADITSYPTWEINGELYPGLRSLDELADLSGYEGSRDF
jgi:glutaredoxin